MSQERNVVTQRIKTFPRARRSPELVTEFDYSGLQVGDWFIVRGKSTFVTARKSFKMNSAAIMMEFEWREVETMKWRVERIS